MGREEARHVPATNGACAIRSGLHGCIQAGGGAGASPQIAGGASDGAKPHAAGDRGGAGVAGSRDSWWC
ncbi:hypothetical protein PLESTF_001331900 [Pleodorina starrii]|nr:hypothetical protein PLESTF_001331900 [Pleodorina starrii]